MSHDPQTAARLDALETHVAHLDRVVTDLNDVIAAQWRKIDQMAREIGRLREEWQNTTPSRNLPEPPPPHY